MKAPALHARRAQQRPSKGAGHGKHQAGITHAQSPNAVAPIGGISLDAKGVFHLALRLEHDALGIIANGFMGQHKGHTMPADAVGAACKLAGLARLDVLGQQVAGAGRWGNAQPHIEQRGAVFAPIARQHAGGHGPLLGLAQRVGKRQQIAPACAVLVTGQGLHVQAATHPHGRLGLALFVHA